MAQLSGTGERDKIKPLMGICEGGLQTHSNILSLKPGHALKLQNYEPALGGGYRRLSGFNKFDLNEVTGQAGAPVLGVCVFGTGVLAAKKRSGTNNSDVFFSIGSGWGTAINGATPRTSFQSKYNFVRYNWTGIKRVIMVDGVDFPARWDGTTYTLINTTAGLGAPVNPKYIEEFKNYIFYAGYTANTGEIKWCNNLAETAFSGGNSGTLVVGDTITGLVRFRDQLIIFCENSIHRLTGSNTLDFQLLPITENIGCIAPNSIVEVGGDILFVGPDGVRTLAATERNDDFELGSISRNIQSTANSMVPTAGVNNVVATAVRKKNQYRVFYPTTGQAETQALGILGGIRSQSEGGLVWEWSTLKGIKPHTVDSSFINEDEYVIHGGFDGFVYRQENGVNFNNTAITSIFRTADITFGDPGIRKTLHRVKIFYKVEGTTTINLGLEYDHNAFGIIQPANITITKTSSNSVYGTGTYGNATYGTEDNSVLTKNTVGSGFEVALNFSVASATDSSHTIQGFVIDYAIAGRR